MSRMTIDCRAVPSESGCSLTISGEEDEVLRAATAHAIDVHGHTDGEELRAGLRAALVPEVAAPHRRRGRVRAGDRVPHDPTARVPGRRGPLAGRDRRRPDRPVGGHGADRNAPDRYVQIVGFPDHESAMANSKHPATSRFAEQLGELCEGEAVFHDLDVRRVQAL